MAQINYDKSTGNEAMKSEQPANVDKLNALDILLPDIHLTNDEKYDMISTKGSEKMFEKIIKKGEIHNGLFTYSRTRKSQESNTRLVLL